MLQYSCWWSVKSNQSKSDDVIICIFLKKFYKILNFVFLLQVRGFNRLVRSFTAVGVERRFKNDFYELLWIR